jgi:hypothetical protein
MKDMVWRHEGDRPSSFFLIFRLLVLWCFGVLVILSFCVFDFFGVVFCLFVFFSFALFCSFALLIFEFFLLLSFRLFDFLFL